MFNFVCGLCKQEFSAKQQFRKYCSINCSNKGRIGRNYAEHGTGSIGAYGYRYIRVSGKRVLEHRHIMERHVRRKLLDQEVVHHKDSNKLNNNIENLEVVSNQGAHVNKHRKRLADKNSKECCRCSKIKSREEFNLWTKKGKAFNKDQHQNMCRNCQSKVAALLRLEKLGTCPKCHRKNIYLQCKGLCSSCYHRQWRSSSTKNP